MQRFRDAVAPNQTWWPHNPSADPPAQRPPCCWKWSVPPLVPLRPFRCPGWEADQANILARCVPQMPRGKRGEAPVGMSCQQSLFSPVPPGQLHGFSRSQDRAIALGPLRASSPEPRSQDRGRPIGPFSMGKGKRSPPCGRQAAALSPTPAEWPAPFHHGQIKRDPASGFFGQAAPASPRDLNRGNKGRNAPENPP